MTDLPWPCEYCYEDAAWKVEAQWSIADWDWIYACDEHKSWAIRQLGNRTVDGALALEMTVEAVVT